MMGTDSDPIVVIDEAGSMAAIKLGEDGNITAATKPSWVDSITLFRKTVLKFFFIYIIFPYKFLLLHHFIFI